MCDFPTDNILLSGHPGVEGRLYTMDRGEIIIFFFQFMVSEICHNYVVPISKIYFSNQRRPVKHSLLVIQIIPPGSGLTPSSVNIHLRPYGIQNSSQLGPGNGIGDDAILFPALRSYPG